MVAFPRRFSSNGKGKHPVSPDKEKELLKTLMSTVQNAIETAVAGNPDLAAHVDTVKLGDITDHAGKLHDMAGMANIGHAAASCLRWFMQNTKGGPKGFKYSTAVAEKRAFVEVFHKTSDSESYMQTVAQMVADAPDNASVIDVALVICAGYELAKGIDSTESEHIKKEAEPESDDE